MRNAKATIHEEDPPPKPLLLPGRNTTSSAQTYSQHKALKKIQISLSAAQGEQKTQGWMPEPMHGPSSTGGRGHRDGPSRTQSGQEGARAHRVGEQGATGQPSPASPLWAQDSPLSTQTPLPSPKPERTSWRSEGRKVSQLPVEPVTAEPGTHSHRSQWPAVRPG